MYRRSRNGRMHLDKEVRASLDLLVAQARAQWNGPPVEHPIYELQLYVRDQRRDKNNLSQTIIDVLQSAGVIVGDTIKRFNNKETILPAIVDEQERAVVTLKWTE